MPLLPACRTAFLLAAVFALPAHGEARRAMQGDTPGGDIKLGAAGGNETRTPSASVRWSGKDGALSYSVTANAERLHLERRQDAREIAHTAAGAVLGVRQISQQESGHTEGLNVAPRLAWELANGDALVLDSFFNMRHALRHLDTAEEAHSGAAAPFAGVAQALWSREQLARSNLAWSRRQAQGRLDVKLGASWEQAAQGNEWTGRTEAGSVRKASATRADAIDRALHTGASYARNVAAGHVLTTSWDLRYATRENTRAQREQALAGIAQANTDERHRGNVRHMTLAASDAWTITPQWSATAGLRWDRIETRASGTTFASTSTARDTASPLLEARYLLPAQAGQLRMALARSFNVPLPRQLMPVRVIAPNNGALEADSTGNPALQPERSMGLDLSWERRLATPGASMVLRASRREIDDLIKNVIRLGGDGRWVGLPVNGGRATTRSAELQFKLPLAAWWDKLPALDLTTSYQHNWSSVHAVPGPDNRVPGQVPYIARLGLEQRRAGLTLGSTFVMRGSTTMRISEQRRRYQGARRELDLFALWKLDAVTQIRASAALARAYPVETFYLGTAGPLYHRTLDTRATSMARIVWERRF